ncbi:hypothetical protein RvY_01925-2 [Ramazzottius varieornatus]|uniref:Uncharacterized protein n=1 Tax=Ramazzottius varieornatus TaxID=947166 RepID=A0A1D1UI29_RAMVA|nr:hypothetical protein RvY_01925-2 [Ramazzottius varieornatus]
MQIWLLVSITLILIGSAAYWSLYQSFGLRRAITVSGNNRKPLYSPACEQLRWDVPSDFLFLTVRTIPRTRFTRLEASLQTWIKDAVELNSENGKRIVNKVRRSEVVFQFSSYQTVCCLMMSITRGWSV